MEKTTDALMTVSGVGKAFGDQQVLADVSFGVASGEILGMIGPNGAGKTTLLECIAGLLPTDAGEVRWRGSPLPPARRKERLFYVPEAISPYPDQSTAEVLKFFQDAYRQPPSRLLHLVREPARRLAIRVLEEFQHLSRALIGVGRDRLWHIEQPFLPSGRRKR